MKRIFLLALLTLAAALPLGAQQVTNRYAMKLMQNEDGTYSLLKEKNYRKIEGLDLDAIPDLLIPYTHQNDRLTGKLYNKVETEEIVYKTENGRELKIAVDKALDPAGPAPVMFFCHGGGWARGNFDASRSLSKYLAQQHGITGVRIEYSLAGPEDVNVNVSLQDVLDAMEYVSAHAAELGVDVKRMGMLGTSAGGHLGACAAIRFPDTKLFVGYSGIYDLTAAAIVQKTKDPVRIAYFCDRDPDVLRAVSPLLMLPKRTSLKALLVCGTADITVECSQSRDFADALKHRKGSAELLCYPNYDHNLSSKTSDKMEEIFFKTVDYIVENL